MDQGLLGKIGEKVGEKVGNANETRKSSDSQRPAEGKAADRSRATDTVELTSSAKLLERLEKTLAAQPAVDSTKVDAVKRAIESGDYQIDAEKIADALLRTDREIG